MEFRHNLTRCKQKNWLRIIIKNNSTLANQFSVHCGCLKHVKTKNGNQKLQVMIQHKIK